MWNFLLASDLLIALPGQRESDFKERDAVCVRWWKGEGMKVEMKNGMKEDY